MKMAAAVDPRLRGIADMLREELSYKDGWKVRRNRRVMCGEGGLRKESYGQVRRAATRELHGLQSPALTEHPEWALSCADVRFPLQHPCHACWVRSAARVTTGPSPSRPLIRWGRSTAPGQMQSIDGSGPVVESTIVLR